MMFNLKLILILLVTITTTFASLGDKYTGRNGVCVNTDTCSKFGGKNFTVKCPSELNDVRCCDNTLCTADDGRNGNCVFSSQCDGETISGKCQEEKISNVVFEKLEKIQHIMGHVMEMVVLALKLIMLIAVLKLFLENAHVEIMLVAMLQEI